MLPGVGGKRDDGVLCWLACVFAVGVSAVYGAGCRRRPTVGVMMLSVRMRLCIAPGAVCYLLNSISMASFKKHDLFITLFFFFFLF